MQRKKLSLYRYNVNTFGPLTSEVKFVPLVFEVTGSFGPAAAEEFSVWCKEAAEAVKQSALALQFADEELRKDRAFIEAVGRM